MHVNVCLRQVFVIFYCSVKTGFTVHVQHKIKIQIKTSIQFDKKNNTGIKLIAITYQMIIRPVCTFQTTTVHIPHVYWPIFTCSKETIKYIHIHVHVI